MIKTIFLTGHRKSGTTMFHRLFDGHPQLVVYPVDVALLYAYFPCFTAQNNTSEANRKKRIENVLQTTLNRAKKRFDTDNKTLNVQKFMDFFWNYMEGKSISSKKNIIFGIASAWSSLLKLCPDNSFLFKETSQAIHFPEILHEIPACKFVNLIRDPRDNYSALKAGVEKYYSTMGEGGLETLASLINRARMDMLSAKLYSKEHPDQFYALRFEDLTARPENEMKKVADFAEIEFDQCLLQPTVFGQIFAGNSYEGKKFNGISSENVGKWKNRISDFEAKVIEFWMGDMMEEWGYERCFPQAQSAAAYGEFYKWYNCKYFYYDSFAQK